MTLIENIDQLRKYVKINASTDWNTYKPFVKDAQEKYITPYFGDILIEKIRMNDADLLKDRVCRALGPFSLALATDELSINFGETGHTVTRTDNLAPASDAKIKKATESLLERAWHNLDQALKHVLSNSDNYAEWKESEYAQRMSTDLFANATEFQDKGMVDIGYSPLTFSRLRMLILRVEKSETLTMIPDDYDYRANALILSAMQAYTASRVAELQTNNAADKSLKDNPPIQFIHEENADSKNYYTSQSAYWYGVMIGRLIATAIIEDSSSLKWNDQDKKVFVANARKV